MELRGDQYEMLVNALTSAFPTKQRLERMIRYKFDLNLENISLGENLTDVVFDIVQEAEANGWVEELVFKARQSNPKNPKLLLAAQQFGLLPLEIVDRANTGGKQIDYRNLEKIIQVDFPFLDVSEWREKLAQLEARICRIKVKLNGGKFTSYGTGFLVSPDCVLTNYHVIEPLILAESQPGEPKWAKPEDVIITFDYKKVANGNILNEGVSFNLNRANWLVHYSPPSVLDELPEPKEMEPSLEELDYALLRVKDAPGDQPIGDKVDPSGEKRGFISVPASMLDLQVGMPILILQHPSGGSLKLAFHSEGIRSINNNHSRITYLTNTFGGSSGSPCFDVHWNLIALHHAGDPNDVPNFKPLYNQGIPIDTIATHMKNHGIDLYKA